MASTQNKRLVATGLLLAIAFILSFIKLYEMPWGGAGDALLRAFRSS